VDRQTALAYGQRYNAPQELVSQAPDEGQRWVEDDGQTTLLVGGGLCSNRS
jgi:hypothetical protein